MFVNEIVAAAGPDRWDGPGAWWPVFPIFWLLVIAGIVTAAVLSGRRRARFSGPRAGERRLAERYAEGLVDEEEYRARRAFLREE